MMEMVLDYLSPYNPKILKEPRREEGGKEQDRKISGRKDPGLKAPGWKTSSGEGGLLCFWSRMINGFEHPIAGNRKGVTHHLSEKMTSSTVHFHPSSGLIEHKDGDKKLYSRVISVKQWPDSIEEDLFAQLFSLPCEFRIVHWLKGQNNVTSSKNLRHEDSKRAFCCLAGTLKTNTSKRLNGWIAAKALCLMCKLP